MQSIVFRRSRRRRGFTMVLFTLAIVTMLAFAGLVIDVGNLQLQRRRAQTAADAAAYAAILEYVRTGSDDNALTAGLTSASDNGFPNDPSNGSTVTMSNLGGNKYQATISRSVPVYFMPVVNPASTPASVSARAVGGVTGGGGGGGCVFALVTGNVEDAFRTDGSSGLDTDCGIQVNSSSSSKAANSEGTVVSSFTKVVGGVTGSSHFTPTPLTGQSVVADPMAFFADPAIPSGCDQNNLSIGASTTITLNPGVYCGGIRVGQSANVTFSSGTYYLKGGGIDTKGYAVIRGTGVAFIQTGPLQSGGTPLGLLLESNTTATLKAPTTGTFAGILWFARNSQSAPNDIQSATTARLEGAIYTPYQDMLVQGKSQAYQSDPDIAKYTILIARTIRVNGTGSTFVIRSDYSSVEGGSPLKRPALVQ